MESIPKGATLSWESRARMRIQQDITVLSHPLFPNAGQGQCKSQFSRGGGSCLSQLVKPDQKTRVRLKTSANILKCFYGSIFVSENHEAHTIVLQGLVGNEASIAVWFACLLQILMSARPAMEVAITSAKTPWAVLTAAAKRDLNY